jgi:SAM-dependent methyltransferase
MKKTHLKYLVCPSCQGDLILQPTEAQTGDEIETGSLSCQVCKTEYAIINHVPRFVPLKNYADGFGLEWLKHSRTQYDGTAGINISEQRFFAETNWPRNLNGETILEIGSGSGRFTEQAAKTGATVVSFDYSHAVEANYASNGNKDNVLIIQASIYQMPFQKNFFDKIFCFGVLQHTPNPEQSTKLLPLYLKNSGLLAFDIYAKGRGIKVLWSTKYLARLVTARIAPDNLYEFCRHYINFIWPLSKLISKIPKLGRHLNWMLLVADYRGILNLPEKKLKEWAILDTFDMLSPKYDFPQNLPTIKKWLSEMPLKNIECSYGYNGIEARAQKI